MNMEQTECSETSAYKIQRPGNYPEESIKMFKARRKFEIKKITFSTFIYLFIFYFRTVHVVIYLFYSNQLMHSF